MSERRAHTLGEAGPGRITTIRKRTSQRTRLVILIAMLASLFVAGCGGSSGGGGDDDDEPSRPSSATCVAQDPPGSPAPPGGGVRLEVAFDGEMFPGALGLVQHPTIDARWYVVRKDGVIETFVENNVAGSRRTALSISVATDAEMGLLGMAFHPGFSSNGLIFLSYVRSGSGSGAGVSVIGRYVSGDGGLTFSADGSGHEILSFEQPTSIHNGGGLAFGPIDGYLYASFGDGGEFNDRSGNGQNIDNLFSTIIRIDVDDEPYSIPPDNPFVGRAGLDEIWAYGFRNPWRFSFDSATGDLWVGDVGQSSFEEIDRIAAGDNSGGNYGWSVMEGSSCFLGSNCQGRTDLIDPIFDYGRDEGASIIGGYVYHGSDLIGLGGTYIYGDFANGRVSSLSGFNGGSPVSTELTSLRGKLVALGEARDGELFVLDLSGRVYQLAGDGTGSGGDDFPTRLSQTGCFEPSNPRQPVSGVIPYEIAAPFWSDGATKERFMSVPAGTVVTVEPDGDFTFPIGTVLAKTFSLGSRVVETRLLMRHDDGEWGGYSYEWDAAGREATLLETSKRVTINGVDWLFPGRADCFRCHTDAAGQVLGPEVAQLNYPIRHGDGRTENQVERLLGNGVLQGPVPDLGVHGLMPGLADTSVDAETRARAYLHSNCSYCHRPGGTGSGPADLRFQTPLAAARICDEVPTRGDLGVSGARIVFPGEPNLSVLLLRMQDLGDNRMPAFASEIVDADAVSVVTEWIGDLNACP